jgi:hypothetical protein
MEPSLQGSEQEVGKPLPEGVTEADLVDGPKVHHLKSGRASFITGDELAANTLVRPIPATYPATTMGGDMAKPPYVAPPSTADIKRDYPAAIELALDVLSARLLGLICLVAACLIWGGIVWSPDQTRIIAGGVFSVTVFLPIMAIYWRAGLTGEGDRNVA